MRVAIALGSNLGNREELLRSAIERLAPHITDFKLSSLHETEPVGVGPQPTFLNGAAVGDTALSARELLHELLAVERELGRVRPYPGAPRTLDLDLILYEIGRASCRERVKTYVVGRSVGTRK